MSKSIFPKLLIQLISEILFHIIILYLYGCTIDQQLNSKSSQLKITAPTLVDVSLTSNSSIDTDDETLLMEENIFQSLLPHILERDLAKRWNISQCYKWVTDHVSPNRLPSDKSKR